MAFILLIETSTNNCSVALAKDSAIVAVKELAQEQYVHAEMLHTFIANVIEQANINIKDLQAIAVSKGPGSYTGLRIGVSAAKGLAFAGSLPLISVNSLQALAAYAQNQWPNYAYYQPMLDARRSEVYREVYDENMNCLQQVQPLIIDEEFVAGCAGSPTVFIGDGAHKCLPWLGAEHKAVSLPPSASIMANIAYEKYLASNFESLAYFEPYYLKDFIPGIAKKAIL